MHLHLHHFSENLNFLPLRFLRRNTFTVTMSPTTHQSEVAEKEKLLENHVINFAVLSTSLCFGEINILHLRSHCSFALVNSHYNINIY